MRLPVLAAAVLAALPLSLLPSDADACAGALRYARARATDPRATEALARIDVGHALEALTIARTIKGRAERRRIEGLAYAAQGKWKSARLALEEAQLQGLDDPRLRRTLADALLRTGEPDTARALLVDLWFEGELDSITHQLLLARLALDSEDLELAFEVVETLRERAPRRKDVRRLVKRLETALDDPTETVVAAPSPVPVAAQPMAPAVDAPRHPASAEAPATAPVIAPVITSVVTPAAASPLVVPPPALPFDATHRTDPTPGVPAPSALRPQTPQDLHVAPARPVPTTVPTPDLRIERPAPIGM